MALLLTITAMLLAAVLGMTAQRTSLCSVKAVAEVLTTRRGYMLASFGKTVLWVIVVTAILDGVARDAVLPATTHAWSVLGILGGFLFGVGAVVNGGCAFSTLSRLASGHIVIVFSLAGFVLGTWVYAVLSSRLPLPAADTAAPAPHARLGGIVLFAGLATWAAWELLRLIRLWRGSSSSSGPGRSLVGPWRLSTAALLIGITNGILYALVGPWSYTHTLGRQVQHVSDSPAAPGPLLWLLFGSLFAGAVVAAWRSGQFRLNWKLPRWRAHLIGGLLMGFGAAFVPGGNDTLVLHGLPSLSPHAFPTFAAILAGVAATLWTVRRMGKPLPLVDCRGDICREAPSDPVGSTMGAPAMIQCHTAAPTALNRAQCATENRCDD